MLLISKFEIVLLFDFVSITSQLNPISPVSAILTHDNSTMLSEEDDTENIGILSVDPSLAPFKDHFKYRVGKYIEIKKLLEKHEGSVEEFAKGDIYAFPTFLLRLIANT